MDTYFQERAQWGRIEAPSLYNISNVSIRKCFQHPPNEEDDPEEQNLQMIRNGCDTLPPFL